MKDFHGILGPHHEMAVLIQKIGSKIKDKLVISVVWIMRDTSSSLGLCFPLAVL